MQYYSATKSSNMNGPWGYYAKWTKSDVKVTQLCPTLRLHGLYWPWNSPGQNSGVGSLSLLQGIFPTRGSNPGLPHCRHILYQLSHKGSPRTLALVAYPFSRGCSWPRNCTRVSCITAEFFTNRLSENSWHHKLHPWFFRHSAYRSNILNLFVTSTV